MARALQTRIEDGAAWLTLARAEVHNAFDDALIAELTASLTQAAADPKVRLVVLAAEGVSFSAGADLRWMARMAGASEEENFRDALGLAELMRSLARFPKPTVARVQGAAYGGGVGLVACCDIAVASRKATFSLSEVRLGLVPAVISPYVVAALGARHARRYFLTAERFGAEEAKRIGLVHEVVEPQALDQALTRILNALTAGGPQAQLAAKRLVEQVAGRAVDAQLARDSAQWIAAMRVSPEGREGVSAFLEKRKPAWTRDEE